MKLSQYDFRENEEADKDLLAYNTVCKIFKLDNQKRILIYITCENLAEGDRNYGIR